MKTLQDIKSTGTKTVTTKKDLVWSKNPLVACVIPKGTELVVHFSEADPGRLYFEYFGFLRSSLMWRAHMNFTGFSKAPGFKALEKWESDGVCKTPTGFRVEPDGWGPDGSPSWLLAMGMI